MLALEVKVEYLMGRALAASREDRKMVEWPPHPARLFAALTAAYAECDLGEEERKALEWLEALPEPAMRVDSLADDHLGRDVHDVFVPINDTAQPPERRSRQVRWFPALTPADPTVSFIWRQTEHAREWAPMLDRVASHVTYLGHSMSPVRVVANATETPTQANLVPDERGGLLLRTTGPGRLEYLEAIHRQRQANSTVQPRLGKVSGYRQAAGEDQAPPPRSLFKQGFVLCRKTGPTLPGEDAGQLAKAVAEAVRGSIIKLVPDPVPEILSGHDSAKDNQPTRKPHLAIAPLLSLSGEHHRSGSHVMGCALWLPDSASQQEIDFLEDALAEVQRLEMGKLGVWEVQRAETARAAVISKSLRLRTYTQPADTWASVTPVVFGHYPKLSQIGPGKNGGKVFADMCDMIGLPPPLEARLSPASFFRGVPAAAEFARPKLAEGKLMAHVWLRFPQKVYGPVLLGRARFGGFGLCRPIVERNPS